ncbi:uncharacterized protein UV8b_02082 [Ustilaginoidea virens]|uniref:Uncharacterized protein n=1 Tax=Ustilaginoidea virens TaxID=1159556 RepID=A0A8E5MFS9_USTVR|nr:uncharacterized protein UV8b_02082 [Ustilaginoidea virens]QUC17841.1 hypothetical protein UV8b_02082 [Ustilaginoidea virens]
MESGSDLSTHSRDSSVLPLESRKGVEFYVSCNPPLGLAGVDEVMGRIQCSDIRVRQAVAKFLLDIVEQDARPLKKQSPSTDPHMQVDVDAGSRLVPWSSWLQTQCFSGFEKYQYPEPTCKLAFKRVWRGLENLPPLTVDNLLGTCSIWSHSVTPLNFEGLAKLLGCRLFHNVRKTVVYIKGDSFGAVEQALKILGHLLLIAETTNKKHHLVYAEDAAQLKYVYKWLSQVGIMRTTYLPRPLRTKDLPKTLNQEGPKLLGAVCIRAAERTQENDWVSDKTQYKDKEVTPSAAPLFSAFKDYAYTKKFPANISGQLEEVKKLLETYNDAEPQSRKESCSVSGDVQSLSDTMDYEEDFEVVDCNPGAVETIPPKDLLDDDSPVELSSYAASCSILVPSPSKETLFQSPHKFNTDKREKSHFMHILGDRVGAMCSVIPLCPGYITISARFGRCYLNDIRSSLVDVGSGPHWTMKELLNEMESKQTCQYIRFSSILSSFSTCADLIVGTGGSSSSWNLLTTQVTYLVECELKEDECFIIEIDAETFNYSCRGTAVQIGCTFIHCVRQAWDVQVEVNKSSNLNLSPLHCRLCKVIVDSLHIFGSAKGETVLEFMANEELGLKIKSVQIQRSARYSNYDFPDSVLSIATMTKLKPDSIKANRQRWGGLEKKSSSGPCPDFWVEAFITSTKLEDVLKANIGLSTGERTSCDFTKLGQQGYYDSLSRPALKMIAQMDHIGQHNNNGISTNSRPSAFTVSVAESRQRNGDYCFW